MKAKIRIIFNITKRGEEEDKDYLEKFVLQSILREI